MSGVQNPLNDAGAWSSTRYYVPGDVVTSGGRSYKCAAPHVNSAPPSGNWTDLGGGAYSLPDATTTVVGGVKIDQNPGAGDPIAVTTPRIGAASGVAGLDSGAHVPLAQLSGITHSQLDAAAGITAGQIASVNPSALTGTGTVPVAGLPVATNSTLGVSRPDNTTLVQAGGVYSVVAGGGSGVGGPVEVTDGTNSVASVATIKFTNGVTVSTPGGSEADVAIASLAASAITSGVLAQAQGGTGLDTSGATDGQVLIGQSSDHTLGLATLTAGSGVTITNAGHSVTIAASSSVPAVVKAGAKVFAARTFN